MAKDGRSLDKINEMVDDGDLGGGGGAQDIDELDDVDTTTVIPNNEDVLEWNGTNWVPGTKDIDGGTF